MTAASWLIGIDPDTVKNGVAIWDTKAKSFVKITSLSLFDIIEFLSENRTLIKKVIIEGGWLNKSNWHTHKTQSVKTQIEIGRRTGMNHQRGLDISELVEGLSISFDIVPPMGNAKFPNTWKKSARNFKAITGYAGVTNPEERDAAMLVFGK